MAGDNSLETISYYLPHYKEYSEDGLIFGGYGPRLFGEGDGNQVENVIREALIISYFQVRRCDFQCTRSKDRRMFGIWHDLFVWFAATPCIIDQSQIPDAPILRWSQ